jgi:hypothetical protein
MLNNEKKTPVPKAEISKLVMRTNASEASNTPTSIGNLLVMSAAWNKPPNVGKVADRGGYAFSVNNLLTFS